MVTGEGTDVARVRAIAQGDEAAVARIYNYYVTDTIITFEEEPVSAEEIGSRISEVRAAGLPWLVAEQGRDVIGYAYASKWKGRAGYRFAVEVTVYLSHHHVGRGAGSLL